MTLPLPDTTPTWRAELQLRFARQGERTVLAERKHVGPLVVQRPFYPEGHDTCHVYLIHPPGGIAGGDRLLLNATLAPGTHVVLTTPAATKFYRALPGRRATLTQQLTVQQAVLEWLPQETIYFNQSSVRTLTRIQADTGSRVLAWEVNCYGRRAGNEPFVSGDIRQGLELWINDRPVLLDHLRVNGGHVMQQAAWGLHGKTALGSLLAYPATVQEVQAVRDLGLDDNSLSCTLIDGALLCRCLCEDGAMARQLLQRVWQVLRPRIVQSEAVPPRIWAT